MVQDRPVTSLPVKLPLTPLIATPDVRVRVLIAVASHGRGAHACIARTPYLAALLNVEHATVRQAINDLAADGYIYPHGDGWKAREPHPGEHWVRIRPDAVERAATSGPRTATRDVQVYALALYLAATRPGPVRQAAIRTLSGIADKRTVNAALARLETAGLVQPTRTTPGAATDYQVFQAPTSRLTSAAVPAAGPSTADASQVRADRADRCIRGASTDASEVRTTGASEVRPPAPIGNTRARGAATYDPTRRPAAADQAPTPPPFASVPVKFLMREEGWHPTDPLPARHKPAPTTAPTTVPATGRPDLTALRGKLDAARATYRSTHRAATGRHPKDLA